MGKKKRRVQTAKPRRQRSGEAGWKKSKALAGMLVIAIVGIWVMIILRSCGSPSPTFSDFPYAYITEEAGAEVLIDKADSDKKKRVPFEKDGKIYWDAYVCKNQECPGRGEDGKDFIFPYVIDFYKQRLEQGKPLDPTPEEWQEMGADGGDMMMMEGIHYEAKCPKCEEAGLEPTDVEPYDTPEGKKMKEELMQMHRGKK